MRVLIRLGEAAQEAEIFDSPLGQALAESLPLEVPFQTAGDEIIFSVPISGTAIEGQIPEEIREGDLIFWPDGNTFVIPLSKPVDRAGREASTPGRPLRLGRIQGKTSKLRDALMISTVRIEPL